jgi:hypothetical protein
MIPLHKMTHQHEAFVKTAALNIFPADYVDYHWLDIMDEQPVSGAMFFVGPTSEAPTFYVGAWINRHGVAELECTSIGETKSSLSVCVNALGRYLHDTYNVRKIRVKLVDGHPRLQRALERIGFVRECFYKDEEFKPSGELVGVVSLSKDVSGGSHGRKS